MSGTPAVNQAASGTLGLQDHILGDATGDATREIKKKDFHFLLYPVTLGSDCSHYILILLNKALLTKPHRTSNPVYHLNLP